MSGKHILGWSVVAAVIGVIALAIRRILIARERIEPSGKYMTTDRKDRL